ncbi:hypothetical protein ACIPWY_35320 [Streptomyces sp. NPDC090032]|uniref:hypothetical protein n=1 Tax=unclassified Streptomyces TaxID=2593676 RepID=UPI003713E71D
MEWGTIITVLIGGLIGLSGDSIGRMGARRQAQRARQEVLEDAETARSRAIEDGSRKEKGDREKRAVENILSAYLENPISLVGQPREEVVLSVIKIGTVLGFEQSFIINSDLRQRVAEICYFLDLAAVGDVGGYSLAEVGFLARSETRMLMGAWARGEVLPDSIEGWGEIRRSRAQIEARWQQKLRDAGLRVVIPPLSIY